MADAVKHIASPAEFASLLASTQYVVADFYADWCGPCKVIAPKYAELAKQHSLPRYMAFAKVNVDTVQAVAQEYGITAMPTFLFFKDGKKVAVNGNAMIQGADWNTLRLASEKMARLAKEKAIAAGAQ
ncbi:thioredoxin-like protein [Podospora appendiculata]|uniref:Thioredoxin-like protein n=1 Tax=Podospora appendiculata TaxID=314037 RepID=A0AAE0WZ83_9PEZI|nr:thioredoxin-like protein [Podospora appendiculata]